VLSSMIINKYKETIELYIESIKQHLKNNLELIYIIGSSATKDIIVNWSDIDCIIVLNKYNEKDIDIIKKISNSFDIKIGNTIYSKNEFGINQCLTNVFSSDSFDYVYSSPYKRTIETAKIVYPYLEPIVFSYLEQRDLGELNEKFKKDYNSEYLKLVRNYVVNPKGAESIQDIIYRLDLFFEYIKSQHDDNSQLLVVTHNGIMRIIKKYYMNEKNNIDSENLGQFKLILKK